MSVRPQNSAMTHLCFPYYISRDIPLEFKVQIIAASKVPTDIRPAFVEVSLVCGGRRMYMTPQRTRSVLTTNESAPVLYSWRYFRKDGEDIASKKKRATTVRSGRIVDLTWNEWVTLPVAFHHLPRYAKLVFSLWDESSPPRRLATSSLPVFTETSTLRQGLQRIPIVLSPHASKVVARARDPTNIMREQDDEETTAMTSNVPPPTSAPPVLPETSFKDDKEAEGTSDLYDELFRLDKLLEKYRWGWGLGMSGTGQRDASIVVPSRIPALDSNVAQENRWFDRLMLSRVESIHRGVTEVMSRHDETVYDERSYLVIELPHFHLPIVYAERPYRMVVDTPRRLNENWIEQSEPFTGRKYYTNVQNHNCQWTPPFSSLNDDRGRSLDDQSSVKDTTDDATFMNSHLESYGGTAVNGRDGMPANWQRRLMVFDDPELDKVNPIHIKYNKIARGIYDPSSKPNKEEWVRIKRIITSPRRRDEIEEEERNLLWQFRHALTGEKKALVKFLYCVDWRYARDVDQATTLLKRWEPIDVDDALLLLSNDFSHDGNTKNALIEHVRRFAVNTLSTTASDDDIISYLLQLVQALRYEPELKVQSPASSSSSTTMADDAETHETDTSSLETEHCHNALRSPLARFLITRAMRSPQLANYLHWYLVAEFSAPTKDDAEVALFNSVHEAFILSLERSGNGAVCIDIMKQTEMLKKLFKAGLENKKLGGSVSAKTKRLINKLRPGGEYEDMTQFYESVPLPYNPNIRVSGILADSPKVFKSAMAPFTATFALESKSKMLAASSSSSKVRDEEDRDDHDNNDDSFVTENNQPVKPRQPSLSQNLSETLKRFSMGLHQDPRKSNELSGPRPIETHRVMFKLGDDLRQDQLILQMITLMDDLLKRVRLDLRLTPFRVMATGHLEGLVEFVPNATPLRYVSNIRTFLQKHNPSKASALGISRSAIQNFVKSCAGYAVISYILGIGDRHLDNIMLKKNGQLFHIDFGYIFGRDPKWNAPLIRLTKPMLEAMGGPQSPHYHTFLELCAQAYNILRQSATLILNLLNLMVDANIDGVTANDLLVVKDRFMLDRSDEDAERFLLQLLRSSVRGLDALWADILDFGHAMAN